jgi:hypothetical protein
LTILGEECYKDLKSIPVNSVPALVMNPKRVLLLDMFWNHPYQGVVRRWTGCTSTEMMIAQPFSRTYTIHFLFLQSSITIDMVDCFRAPDHMPAIAEEAVAIGRCILHQSFSVTIC